MEKRFCDGCNLPGCVAGVLHPWPDKKWLCLPCQQVRLLKEDQEEVRFKVYSSY